MCNSTSKANCEVQSCSNSTIGGFSDRVPLHWNPWIHGWKLLVEQVSAVETMNWSGFHVVEPCPPMAGRADSISWGQNITRIHLFMFWCPGFMNPAPAFNLVASTKAFFRVFWLQVRCSDSVTRQCSSLSGHIKAVGRYLEEWSDLRWEGAQNYERAGVVLCTWIGVWTCAAFSFWQDHSSELCRCNLRV